MRFVCSFAWADLEVSQQEKDYVRRLVQRLNMPEEEQEAGRRVPEAAAPTGSPSIRT